MPLSSPGVLRFGCFECSAYRPFPSIGPTADKPAGVALGGRYHGSVIQVAQFIGVCSRPKSVHMCTSRPERCPPLFTRLALKRGGALHFSISAYALQIVIN